MFWWLKSKKLLVEDIDKLLKQVEYEQMQKEYWIRKCQEGSVENARLIVELAKAIKEPYRIILVDGRKEKGGT